MRSDRLGRTSARRAFAQVGLRVFAGAGAWLLAGAAQAFTVFACEPEWAALARVVMPAANIHVATHGRQDPHHIEARPALIAQLRRADLAVCTGASLEAGWLPMLQQRAGNPRVRDGAPGMFYVADHVDLIDPQPGAGLFDGDVHPEGNPHPQLDPRRLLDAARALADRMAGLVPAQEASIRERLARFETDWTSRIADWERRAVPLRGRTVAAQHSTHGYVWHWLGIAQVADLEPRPGMAPTPGHLQRLLQAMRAAPPLAIVVAPYQDPRAARWLAGQLGPRVPLLVLPSTVDDDAAPDALVRMVEQVLQPLLDAAR
jgi:zinc/manganese transport system substrate-binding protein